MDSREVLNAINTAVDHVIELLNQGAIHEDPDIIFHGCISTYEDAMRYLIEIGKMEDLGRGRARFIK